MVLNFVAKMGKQGEDATKENNEGIINIEYSLFINCVFTKCFKTE